MELPPVHLIYEEAAGFSLNDIFWRSMLQFASRGKFPQGFFVRRGCLCYKTPKNQILRKAIGETPRDANVNFIEFVKECTRTRSDIDVLREREESYLENGEIKASKGVPEILLYNHFDLCREAWGVSDRAINSYERIVFLLVRIFGKKIVDYDSDGTVNRIKGIVFDEDNDEFAIDAAYTNRLNRMTTKPQELLQKKKANIIHQKVNKENFEKTLLAIQQGRKSVRMEEFFR